MFRANRRPIAKLRLSVAALAMLYLHLSSAYLMAQGRTDVLVLEGQAAPDGNGTFSSFLSPLINSSGEVAFFGGVTGTSGGSSDNSGIFRATDSGTLQVARGGQTVPGGNGQFSSFSTPRSHNSHGQVLFFSSLIGTSGGLDDNNGIFRGDGNNLVQIARKGQTAPDGNGTLLTFNSSTLNQAGQAVFVSSLAGTSGGTSDNLAIYRGDGGFLTQIARKGSLSPDSNGEFSTFGPTSINNAGQVAFRATLTGTNGGTSDYSGIYSGSGGVLTQIVRGGQALPGGNGVFADFNFSNNQTFNNAGQAAFYAILGDTAGGSADDRGIYRGSGSGVTQIVREGQNAPDANGTFSDFGSAVLNDAGQVAFFGSLTGTHNGTLDNSGVFRGNGGAITQIVRKGQTAYDNNGSYSSFHETQIGSSGLVLMRSVLTGTSGGSFDNTAIILGDGTDLIKVARLGDSLSGSTAISLSIDPAEALNDYGQVAYRGTLANGNEFINRWTPELRWRGTSSSTWDTAGRWTLGLNPAQVHDTFIDSAASLTVTGPATNRTVRSLQIGGGNGLVTLDLRNGATLTALNGVAIESTGTLTGDGSISGLTANRGTIVADNLVFANTLTNFRSIRGTGRIHAALVNASGGEILANGGENLWLSGPSISNQNGGRIRALAGSVIEHTGTTFSNAGLIEVHQGSEFRIQPRLSNLSGTGLISVRDGSLIGSGGIANAGSIALTLGNSIIQGDITNTGIIQVSGGAYATFFDDVLQNGTLQVAAVGNTSSTAVILGAFSGSGGFVGGGDVFALGDLRPGNSPASVLYDGNLFLGSSTETFIELGGIATGDFDQMLVTGDLNLGGSLFVSLIDNHQLRFNQQYLIGNIEGLLSGQFAGLGEGALVGNFGGKDLFISYAAGGGNNIALFTSVPEPGVGLVLVVIGLAGLTTVRRSKAATSSTCRKPVVSVLLMTLTKNAKLFLTFVTCLVLIDLETASALAQPTFTNLGTLTGGSLSIAQGISADGTTIVGYSNFGQFTNNRAFRWTSTGGIQDLGTLPSYSDSIAYGVSSDGSVIVGGGSGFSHAWRWSASTGMSDLGTLPGGANSIAQGVSGDGDLVAGWSQSNGGTQLRPFNWTNTAGMSELSLLNGGTVGQVSAVSGNGSYFAGRSNFAGSGSTAHAVRWGPNGIEDLGALASGGASFATAISHDGSVVVGVTATNNGDRAFRWTESGGMENLGVVLPPGTFPTSIAFAVSGDGQVIGGRSNSNAFLWTQALGTIDLKTWLVGQGVDLNGWVLTEVTGLSFDGSVIAGNGFLNNQQRAWVVNLNASIPEPSLGWLIAAAAMTATCQYRRRRV